MSDAPAGFLGLGREAWRDAGRLGLQSGVAGALGFVAASAAGLSDAFLVIMMAVTSLERSVGGTLGQSAMRLQSALAGSALGLLCLLLVPDGWGVAGALGVALGAVGAASALRPAWALGVVPAVGMSLGDRDDVLGTAVTTSIGIALGALIGALVSLLVWPDRAEARFERRFRDALRATALRLSDAVSAVAGAGAGRRDQGRERGTDGHVQAWNEAMWLAAEALDAAKFVDRAGMERRLEALRRLHDAVVILDRAAEAEVRAGLGPEAEALGQEACAALTAMADDRPGETPSPAERIGTLDAALERIEASLAADDPASREHHVRDAMAFGLREVRRSLAALIDAGGPP